MAEDPVVRIDRRVTGYSANTVLSYSDVRRSEKCVRTGPEEETSLIVQLCGDTVAVIFRNS